MCEFGQNNFSCLDATAEYRYTDRYFLKPILLGSGNSEDFEMGISNENIKSIFVYAQYTFSIQ